MVSVRLASLVLLATVSCGGAAGAPPSRASSPAVKSPEGAAAGEPSPTAPDLPKPSPPPPPIGAPQTESSRLPEDGRVDQGKSPEATATATAPTPRPSPPMAATTQSLSGRLNEAQVGQVVTAGIDAFSTCTRIDATVTVSLNIDAEGRVGEAVAARSEPDDAKMRDCVVRGFKTLKFPRSTDGRGSPVRFELRLTPKT